MIGRLFRAFDGFQQRHTFLGFPLAVMKKFGDDNGGHQATLLAYYGFFSILPLLLVAVTVLTFVLQNNDELKQDIIESALSQFPIIGQDIGSELQAIRGNAIALIVGVLGALWGGLGGIRAMQDTMNVVWDVPHRERPGFLPKIFRALIMLAVFGGFMLLSTAISGAGSLWSIPSPLTLVASAALNVGVFLLAFKVLTSAELSVRDVLPGALIAGVVWSLLLHLGTYIVGRRLEGASALYGFFGIVIGLLAWLYLGAQVTLYAAEINVVLKCRLWPRAIDMSRLTPVDQRALERRARVEERVKGQEITVTFDDQTPRP